jgi:hypothetical protein
MSGWKIRGSPFCLFVFVGEDSLLERVTAAAEQRQLSLPKLGLRLRSNRKSEPPGERSQRG